MFLEEGPRVFDGKKTVREMEKLLRENQMLRGLVADLSLELKKRKEQDFEKKEIKFCNREGQIVVRRDQGNKSGAPILGIQEDIGLFEVYQGQEDWQESSL